MRQGKRRGGNSGDAGANARRGARLTVIPATAGSCRSRWSPAPLVSAPGRRIPPLPLVVEIVSPDKPERDLVEKRNNYAEAQVPEYWLVDPQDETITVLRLASNAYVEHGVFRRGMQATSALLEELMVDVDAVFGAV